MQRIAQIISVCACAALPVAVAAEEQTPVINGQDEFISNCAPCHGEDGRGNGHMDGTLVKAPSDLTNITKRNLGLFPSDKIADIIAGRKARAAHQSFQMPKFLGRFRQFEGKRGFDQAELKIQAIVRYLRSVQVP